MERANFQFLAANVKLPPNFKHSLQGLIHELSCLALPTIEVLIGSRKF